MRASQLFFPTLREVPADAEMTSHKLLLRGGFIRRVGAGIYDYLPLGYKVIKKIEKIVREEMDAQGAQELLMPAIVPAELYQETGRWDLDVLFRFKDRSDREYAIGFTHEEVDNGYRPAGRPILSRDASEPLSDPDQGQG